MYMVCVRVCVPLWGNYGSSEYIFAAHHLSLLQVDLGQVEQGLPDHSMLPVDVDVEHQQPEGPHIQRLGRNLKKSRLRVRLHWDVPVTENCTKADKILRRNQKGGGGEMHV